MLEVIEVGFSPEDEDLVEIIEAVAEAAEEINKGQLKAEDKKERRFYIDTLVKRYFGICRDTKNSLPSKSLFSESVNSYVSENYKGKQTMSKIIKSLMRELVLNSYDRCRRLYTSPGIVV